MTGAVHEQMAENPSKLNPFDVMIGLVAAERDPRQPARAYVWLGETVWQKELEKVGALPNTKKDEETGEWVLDIRDSKPFGVDGRTVGQQTMIVPDLSILTRYIWSIPGAAELITHAHQQTKSQ
jgi:hypothetical protein